MGNALLYIMKPLLVNALHQILVGAVKNSDLCMFSATRTQSVTESTVNMYVIILNLHYTLYEIGCYRMCKKVSDKKCT